MSLRFFSQAPGRLTVDIDDAEDREALIAILDQDRNHPARRDLYDALRNTRGDRSPRSVVMIHLTEPRDTLKALRETLCVAQTALGHWAHDSHRRADDVARIGRIINEIDRQRPLGSDGKHGERHTPTCGCDEAPVAA